MCRHQNWKNENRTVNGVERKRNKNTKSEQKAKSRVRKRNRIKGLAHKVTREIDNETLKNTLVSLHAIGNPMSAPSHALLDVSTSISNACMRRTTDRTYKETPMTHRNKTNRESEVKVVFTSNQHYQKTKRKIFE